MERHLHQEEAPVLLGVLLEVVNVPVRDNSPFITAFACIDRLATEVCSPTLKE